MWYFAGRQISNEGLAEPPKCSEQHARPAIERVRVWFSTSLDKCLFRLFQFNISQNWVFLEKKIIQVFGTLHDYHFKLHVCNIYFSLLPPSELFIYNKINETVLNYTKQHYQNSVYVIGEIIIIRKSVV